MRAAKRKERTPAKKESSRSHSKKKKIQKIQFPRSFLAQVSSESDCDTLFLRPANKSPYPGVDHIPPNAACVSKFLRPNLDQKHRFRRQTVGRRIWIQNHPLLGVLFALSWAWCVHTLKAVASKSTNSWEFRGRLLEAARFGMLLGS